MWLKRKATRQCMKNGRGKRGSHKRNMDKIKSPFEGLY